MRDLMKRPRLLIIAAVLGLAVLGCDKSEPAPSAGDPGTAVGVAPSPATPAVAVASPGATAAAAATAPPKAAATASNLAPAQVKPAPVESSPDVPFTGKRIAVVHTSNVVGELEPCG